MKKRPDKIGCNICDREVTSEKNMEWILTPGLGRDIGFWSTKI